PATSEIYTLSLHDALPILTDGADGWAPGYCISKTALNGVTVQFAAALPEFAVNAVCPGWVRTDMGGANATRSVAEGASGIVWLRSEEHTSELQSQSNLVCR